MPYQMGLSCRWTNDCQRFLLEHFDTIQNSPSQIYHSALPFCPASSYLHKYYAADLSHEVKVVKGLPAGWEACSHTVSLGNSLQGLSFWNNIIAVGSFKDIILLDGITGNQTAVLFGHSDWVTSVDFSSDGKLAASGSNDRMVMLWDTQTGGVVKAFSGHSDNVTSVSISLDSAMIASGSSDKTIHIWNIQKGECYHVIRPKDIVRWVSFSPTAAQCLLSRTGTNVRQWNIEGHSIEPTYSGSCTVFSSDGTRFALCNKTTVTVQDFKSGEIVAEFNVTSNSPEHCCFSPDGKFIAVACDRTISVWDITGSDPYEIETFTGHTNSITGLLFSSPSSLVSVSKDQSAKFWEITIPQTDSPADDPKPTPVTSSPIKSVGLQPGEKVAISCDVGGVVKTWNLSTGLSEISFPIPAKNTLWADAQLIDGRLVVVWFKRNKISVWDTERGELLKPIFVSDCRGLRISGDGSKVFCLSIKSINAWSMSTGEPAGQAQWESVPYMDDFYSDGSKIWIRFEDSLVEGLDFDVSDSSPTPLLNTSVERPHLEFMPSPFRIEDRNTGKKVFQLSGRYAKPQAVQWNGQYLVAGYSSGEVLILNFCNL